MSTTGTPVQATWESVTAWSLKTLVTGAAGAQREFVRLTPLSLLKFAAVSVSGLHNTCIISPWHLAEIVSRSANRSSSPLQNVAKCWSGDAQSYVNHVDL